MCQWTRFGLAVILYLPPCLYAICESTSTLDASMPTQVSKTVSNCFAALRLIRNIRQCVSRPVMLSMLCYRGFCNDSTLATRHSPISQLTRSTDCSPYSTHAARLAFSRSIHDHVTPLLQELHWLRIEQRIEFKLSVLVFRCLNGLAPSYLSRDLQRVSDLAARRRLRMSLTSTLVVPPTPLSTVGDRAFPVAAARTWNSFPHLSHRYLHWRLSGVS